jgi:hypothetical protein
MVPENANEGGPPLGSAPGYGELLEGGVGDQGTGQAQKEQAPSATPEKGQTSGAEAPLTAGGGTSGGGASGGGTSGGGASGGGTSGGGASGGGASGGGEATSETPLFKENLLADEKGTSLDEGGAG